MTTLDFSPFRRSTVGFDRLFNLLEDEASPMGGEPGYPPYNIERTGEDTYQVTLALAGFSADDIAITATQDMLTVEGRRKDSSDRTYLYQGISGRPFRRQFNLADYLKVTGATFENGLLQIELVREVPEAMKPRRIDINSSEQKRVEHFKAA
jgi:molecular chaperone IbpA